MSEEEATQAEREEEDNGSFEAEVPSEAAAAGLTSSDLEDGAAEDGAPSANDVADAEAEGDLGEVVELELSDDDIVRYLEDEEGNRIGFVIMEDGEEAEYLYVDDGDSGEDGDAASAEAEAGDDSDDIGDLGITREGVQEATDDMNAIMKDGVAVAAELKGAFDDIKGALDFGSWLK